MNQDDRLETAWRSRALTVIGAVITHASSPIISHLVSGIKPEVMRDLKSVWELIIHCINENAAPHREMLLVLAERDGLSGVESILDDASEKWLQSGISLDALAAVLGDMVDLAYRLYLIDAGKVVISQAQNLVYEPGEVISSMLKRFQNLAALIADPQPLDAILDELAENDGSTRFIPTGFAGMDEALNGGLGRGKLCVVGGRPGMMKTSWALELAARVATRGYKVLFFSLEMARDEIVRWLVRAWAGLRTTPWTLNQTDHRISSVMPLLRAIGNRLLIDDSTPKSLGEIVAVTMAHRPDLVIVDYVELLSDVGDDANDGMRQAVVRVYRSLRAMAKNAGCAVVVLSQFNRQVELVSNRVPQLSHFMWGGEADADVALGMYFPARLVNSGLALAWPPFVEKDINGYPRKDRLYVLVLKNRAGASTIVPFSVAEEGLRIDDLKRPATR